MKAMNINKTLLASALAALVSTSANAKTIDFDFTFATVPDVTLSPVTPMSFGKGLKLAQNTTCSMTVAGGTDAATYATTAGRPSSTAAKLGVASAISAGTDYQKLGGGGCGTGAGNDTTGTAGVYKITGAQGVSVDVTVKAITAGVGVDFTYVPDGCIANYDDAPNGDFCLSGAASGSDRVWSGVQLASNNDLGSASGVPAPGESLIFLGGAITTQRHLDAGMPYTQNFTIEVTY